MAAVSGLSARGSPRAVNASYAGRVPVTPPTPTPDVWPGFNQLATSNLVVEIKRRYNGIRTRDVPHDVYEDL